MEMLSVGYAERGHTWAPDTLLVRADPIPPRRVLRVTWPACCGPVLTPRVVRGLIEEALRRGWLTEHADLELDGTTISVPGAN
jgi:hypothetical protein